jgi:putative nucleotidyltransferase with HDIG domain
VIDQRQDEVIASALEIARQSLGMEAAHIGRFIPGYQEIRQVSGDGDRFGLEPGTQVPFEDTFCKRMVAGQIPQVIPDVTEVSELDTVPLAADGTIGAYVGVPVTSSDGTVWGTFCCLSDHREPELAGRDITFMRVLGQLIGDRLQRQALEARERERLVDLVDRRTEELELAQAETAVRLSRAVEFRDDDTGSHIERVALMAEMLARAAGADEAFCALLRLAAPLHDVGKVATPDEVLKKAGALTHEERQVIQNHTEVGYELLADSASSLLRLAASIARTHHERFDGGGYSQRIGESQIPLEGRIVAIADVFDALTQKRVYRNALPAREAVAIMRADEGHFDPDLLDIFITTVVPVLPFELPAGRG